MAYPIKQGSTEQALVFLMVESADHITGLTSATPTVTISKNTAAFASPAGSVTEIGDGWYKVAPNATDNATLGPLLLHATASGGDPVDKEFIVVGYDPQVAWSVYAGGAVDSVTGAVGSVTAGVTVATNDDKTGYSLAAAGLDAITVETDLNARQALSIIAAESAGVLAGATSTTITIAGAGVVTNRITATVDTNGNRTAVAVSPPT